MKPSIFQKHKTFVSKLKKKMLLLNKESEKKSVDNRTSFEHDLEKKLDELFGYDDDNW